MTIQERRGKCRCVNVEIQTYTNQVQIPMPDRIVALRWRVNPNLRPLLSIDRCIAEEISDLHQVGITTTGCCCGHNTHEPYIGVIDEHIGWMERLGYLQARPDGAGHALNFYPKSVELV